MKKIKIIVSLILWVIWGLAFLLFLSMDWDNHAGTCAMSLLILVGSGFAIYQISPKDFYSNLEKFLDRKFPMQ